MRCGECGASVDPAAKFCASCGTPVSAAGTACGSCGAALKPGARFCAECGAPVADHSEADAHGAGDGGRERKVATLLFADLVGFTALNERHDPEVIEAVVGRAFERLSAEIARYEGTVEKFAGDAMLAVFGVPTTHEDDAERAVRAALEMQSAIGELRAQLEAEGRPGLALRIGIETGEVLANAQRATAERDRMVTGDAVNTAARLEQAAAEGAVVVGPGTYAATREVVEYEELEAIALKGKTLPVPAWRAVRIKSGRGGRRAVLGLEAPLIGRDEELTLLKETVRRTVAESRPHLVTVLGSAGVGKSRLTWELEKYLDGLPDTYHWRKGRCLAYAQMSYSALADAITSDASVLDDDSPEAVETKVTARLADLAGGTPAEQMITAVRGLLGLPSAAGLPRDELFEAWRAYLELIARRFPFVLVLEDIHWADEGLLDFIEFMARWAEGPIMILCLARHELLERRPAWAGGLPNATTIVLEPLSREESGRLLGALLGSALPSPLQRRVVDVAEGNPLFAEELVRLFVDRGVVRHTDAGWEQAQPIDAVEIPQSIQALLAARLDSLPAEEKRMSQDAAVVGRIFWDRLLAHLAGQSPGTTVSVLRSLRVKELVVPREPSTLTDAQEYAFRHVLIRDVAYDSLPKLERARKHREVARWAEDRLGERAEEVVELLAAHYWSALRYEEEFATDDAALAELRRRTIEYARAAGKRAFGVSQYASAAQWMRIMVDQARKLDVPPAEYATLVVDYLHLADLHEPYEARLEAAREAVGRLMALEERSDEERKLVASLRDLEGYLLFSSTATPVDEVKATIRKGLEILEGMGPTSERAHVLHRLGWISWRAGPIPEAEAPLRQALEEARAAGEDGMERWAMHDLGIVLTHRDVDPEGLRMIQRSMEMARESGDVILLGRCYVNLPGTLEIFGRLEEAIAMAEEGLDRARRSNDRHSIFWIGNNLATFYGERGELLKAVPIHEEAIAAARDMGFREVAGLHEYALTLLPLGRFDEARSIWHRADEVEPIPEPQARSRAFYLDGIFRWVDDPRDGIQRVRTGIDIVRDSGETDFLPHLCALLARMGVRSGDAEAIHHAVPVVRAIADRTPIELFMSMAAWVEGLAESDPATAGARTAVAAERLTSAGRPIEAGDAFADAALLAARAGFTDDARTWAERAQALYQACAAVPVLDLIGATEKR